MSAAILTGIESCPRRGLWTREWESIQLPPIEVLRRAVIHGLTTDRQDYSEAAGEYVMEFCADRGMDIDTQQVHVNLYDIGIHYAALADLITTYLRSVAEFKALPDMMVGNHIWKSSALEIDANAICRVILCSRWDDERLAAELHSWYTLGEMAIYERPIDIHVIVLGQSTRGMRTSAWAKGFLHPRNRALRFKRDPRSNTGVKGHPFGPGWHPVRREDYAQISREHWLEAMRKDECFETLHHAHAVRLPSRPKLDMLREMMKKKLNVRYKGIPDPNYSQCDNVVSPCWFRRCCLGKEDGIPNEEEFMPIASAE